MNAMLDVGARSTPTEMDGEEDVLHAGAIVIGAPIEHHIPGALERYCLYVLIVQHVYTQVAADCTTTDGSGRRR